VVVGKPLLLAGQAGDAVVEGRIQGRIGADESGTLGVGQCVAQLAGLPLVVLGHFYQPFHIVALG